MVLCGPGALRDSAEVLETIVTDYGLNVCFLV